MQNYVKNLPSEATFLYIAEVEITDTSCIQFEVHNIITE